MTNPLHIVVFGGTSAIAQATARLWAAQGAHLVLVGRHLVRLQSVADDLKARGAKRAEIVQADLLDLDRCATSWKDALAILGHVDVVLLAQGTLSDQQACAANWEMAEREFRLNFLSFAAILTEVANTMETRKQGQIAIISSVAGDRGRQSNYYYGSAKAALTTFAQGLRNRLTPANVQVLTIKPGFVDTPMTAHLPKGPLFAAPEVVARGILKALRQGKSIVYLPFFWRWIMCIICAIPEGIFKRLRL